MSERGEEAEMAKVMVEPYTSSLCAPSNELSTNKSTL